MLFAASLPGCIAGPDYVQPATPPLPANYTGQSPASPDSLTDLTGQTNQNLFADPILTSLLIKAEQQNLSLAEAYHRILEARAQVGVVRGDLFPKFTANGSYSYKKRSRNARPFVGSNGIPFDLFSLGYDTVWEIDLFGKLKRAVEASEAELNAQNENYQDVRLTLQTDIAKNYIQLRVLQEQIEIAKQNLRLQEKSLQLVEDRKKAGRATELDVAQAKSLRYFTLSEIPLLEQQAQVVLNRMSLLLGEASGTALRDFIGQGEIPHAPNPASMGLPANLLRCRPDVRLAEQEVVAASARIGIAEAELYPQFSLLGTLSVGSRNASSLFQYNSLAFSVGPSVQWNILQFGRVKNNILVYQAQYDQAVDRYRNAVLVAYNEVENGLAQWQWEKKRGAILAKSIQADQKAVQLSMARYKTGKTSFLRIRDTQERLLRNQQTLAKIRGAIGLHFLKVYKAVGGACFNHSENLLQGSCASPPAQESPREARLFTPPLLAPIQPVPQMQQPVPVALNLPAPYEAPPFVHETRNSPSVLPPRTSNSRIGLDLKSIPLY